MTTVSPDSMVSAGLVAALKFPMFTVCGLGISVYSAACARPMSMLHIMMAQATSCARAGATAFIPGLIMSPLPNPSPQTRERGQHRSIKLQADGAKHRRPPRNVLLDELPGLFRGR